MGRVPDRRGRARPRRATRSPTASSIARYNRGEADAIEFTEFYLSTLARFDDDAAGAAARALSSSERIRPRIPSAAARLVDRAPRRRRPGGHHHGGRSASWPSRSPPSSASTTSSRPRPRRVDGRYTGRVAGTPNIREGKVERLHRVAGRARSRGSPTSARCWVYSDSLNDLPLLSQVTHPVAVNADPVLAAHARHHGWPIVQFALIAHWRSLDVTARIIDGKARAERLTDEVRRRRRRARRRRRRRSPASPSCWSATTRRRRSTCATSGGRPRPSACARSRTTCRRATTRGRAAGADRPR